jgi:putative membrane protein
MKPFLQFALVALSAALFGATPAFAQKGQVDSADAKAMKNLAQANLAEIETGKLAASKAESPEVKQFGQRMVDDHGKMLDALKQLAQEKGVELPTQPKAGDAKKLQKLQALSGEKFDRTYMSEMVKDHRKDVKDTAGIAKKAKDADLKSAVQQANQTISEHLQSAQQIAKAEKEEGGKSAGSGASAGNKR